jgi:hypothetical protein
MRIKNYLTGIQGVAASQTATINVPVNRRYHELHLFLTNGGVASDVLLGISLIRISVNGVLMRMLTPAQILAIAAVNTAKWTNTIFAPAVGHLPIFLSEPWRPTVVGAEAVSWPVYNDLGVSTMTIQIDFTAVAAPGLTAVGVFDFQRNLVGDKQFVTPIKQLPFAYNAPLGQFTITDLPIQFPIQKILFFGAQLVSNVQIDADSARVLEATSAENASELESQGIDGNPNATLGLQYPVCFDGEQQLSSGLQVANTLTLYVTNAAAQTLTALVEQRADNFR